MSIWRQKRGFSIVLSVRDFVLQRTYPFPPNSNLEGGFQHLTIFQMVALSGLVITTIVLYCYYCLLLLR